MKHIYTNKETEVSLWLDDYDFNCTPYVIKIGKREKYRVDEFSTANQLYNQTIIQEKQKRGN